MRSKGGLRPYVSSDRGISAELPILAGGPVAGYRWQPADLRAGRSAASSRYPNGPELASKQHLSRISRAPTKGVLTSRLVEVTRALKLYLDSGP